MADAKQFNIGGQTIKLKDEEAREMIDNINTGYLRIKDLGTSYTAELKEDISSGTFKKAVVGGKLTINSHVYYLAHPNYWLHTGDTACETNHMLVVPAGNLASGVMNDSHVTTGAYVGSKMKGENGALKTAADIIKADFGAANILTHREYFANAVSNGKQSAGAWYDSDIDLMNEEMVYGCPIFTPACDGTTVPCNYTVDKSQIELFQKRPDLITTRADWWLRDVVSGTCFALVSDYGGAYRTAAGLSHGVRPAFAIC